MLYQMNKLQFAILIIGILLSMLLLFVISLPMGLVLFSGDVVVANGHEDAGLQHPIRRIFVLALAAVALSTSALIYTLRTKRKN